MLVLEHVQVVQAVRLRVRRFFKAFFRVVRLSFFAGETSLVAFFSSLGGVPETQAGGSFGDPVHVHVIPGEGEVQHHGHRAARPRVRVAVEGFLPRLIFTGRGPLALEIESALVVEHRRLAAVHGQSDAQWVVRHDEFDDSLGRVVRALVVVQAVVLRFVPGDGSWFRANNERGRPRPRVVRHRVESAATGVQRIHQHVRHLVPRARVVVETHADHPLVPVRRDGQ
mmetsp:Transcript_13218/g.55515  ORF Transcript_13218/g.55515 Transcript_13218/m.55515 type:complete len:226 (+) Transcript_13218:4214-4891(+)